MSELKRVDEWVKNRPIKFTWGHLGYEVTVGENEKGQGQKIKISSGVLSKIQKGEYTTESKEGYLYVYDDTKRRVHHQTGRPFHGIEYELNESVGVDNFIKTLEYIEEYKNYTEPTERDTIEELTYKDIKNGKRFEVVPYGWGGTVIGENADGKIVVYLKEVNRTIEVDKDKSVKIVYRDEKYYKG